MDFKFPALFFFFLKKKNLPPKICLLYVFTSYSLEEYFIPIKISTRTLVGAFPSILNSV